MLGIRTWGRKMVGADETTELWEPRAYDNDVTQPFSPLADFTPHTDINRLDSH